MLDLIGAYWSELISFLAGAAGGSLVTFKYARTQRVTGSGRNVDQSGSSVTNGDMVGGNKTTTTKSGPKR